MRRMISVRVDYFGPEFSCQYLPASKQVTTCPQWTGNEHYISRAFCGSATDDVWECCTACNGVLPENVLNSPGSFLCAACIQQHLFSLHCCLRFTSPGYTSSTYSVTWADPVWSPCLCFKHQDFLFINLLMLILWAVYSWWSLTVVSVVAGASCALEAISVMAVRDPWGTSSSLMGEVHWHIQWWWSVFGGIWVAAWKRGTKPSPLFN